MDDTFDFETEELAEAKREKELTAKYRHIFLGSPMGLEVLADILQLCHFGVTLSADDEAQIGEHTIGTLILGRCGIFRPGAILNIVQSLASVVPEE